MTTKTKQATIVAAADGFTAVELRSERDAGFVKSGGGLVFGCLADAEQAVEFIDPDYAPVSKKLKVAGLPVVTPAKAAELRAAAAESRTRAVAKALVACPEGVTPVTGGLSAQRERALDRDQQVMTLADRLVVADVPGETAEERRRRVRKASAQVSREHPEWKPGSAKHQDATLALCAQMREQQKGGV